MEFEMVEGVAEMFEAAEAEAEGLALSEGSQVEANAAVEELAEGPAIEPAGEPAPAGAPSTVAQIRTFIQNNPYANKMWQFAQFAGKNAAAAGIMFGITYGLNRVIAQQAHDTGKRTALSQYLQGVQQSFEKNDIPWDDETKALAAKDALSFPWIDATQ